MKRAIAILLLLAMTLSLCACGGVSKKSCTVTFSNGTTKTLSPSELSDICSKDAVSWKSYVGAKISGTGKITSIKEGHDGFYNITHSSVKDGVEYKYQYYQVVIDKYIVVLTRAEVFSGMSVGDTVRFEGEINSGSSVYSIRVDYGDDSPSAPQQHIFPD